MKCWARPRADLAQSLVRDRKPSRKRPWCTTPGVEVNLDPIGGQYDALDERPLPVEEIGPRAGPHPTPERSPRRARHERLQGFLLGWGTAPDTTEAGQVELVRNDDLGVPTVNDRSFLVVGQPTIVVDLAEWKPLEELCAASDLNIR